MEALCILDTREDIENAVIATKQALVRQGLDPTGFVASIVHPETEWGKKLRYGWMFSTVGLTDAEHSARLNELKELGQFND